MQLIFDMLLQQGATMPDTTKIDIETARRLVEAKDAQWNTFDRTHYLIERFSIPGSNRIEEGQSPIRVLQISHSMLPATDTPPLVYLHGGGWTFCSAETHLGVMADLARLTGCRVVGIDYRLAPESPYPAALNDCAAAWDYLANRDNAPGAITLCGDSAGANLALALMLRLKEQGKRMPAAAALFYGVYSANHDTASHRLYGQGGYALTSEKMTWYRNNYLRGVTVDPHDIAISPLLGDMYDFPPCFIAAAGLDPLRDDSVVLAQRLTASDADCELRVYEGVIHGFVQMAARLPDAELALADAAHFLLHRRS